MDQAEFADHVSRVLDRLYDLPYLQTHVLAQLLVGDVYVPSRGQALRQTFLDAMRVLKPPELTSGSSSAWRAYRYLFLRYVQMLPPAEVARELGVSERQARRTYREALDALVSVLWDLHLRRRRVATSGQTIMPIGDLGATHDARQENDREPDAEQVEVQTSLAQEVHRLTTARPRFATDLPEVVLGLKEIIGQLAEQRGCKWRTSSSAPLPRISVDRAVLRQILLNLCTAILELGPGMLELSASHRPEWVLITVERATAGRAGPTALAVETLALAESRLAVSRSLVEAERGSLEVRTTEDRIAVVVSLRSTPRLQVLVIDDNPDIATMFRRYLESAGFEVIEAEGGAEGVRLARELHPAVITLDVMMTSQDGWETLQDLKNHPETRSIPVLICSVLREQELARFLGASALLPKPVTRSSLLKALASCGVPVPPEEY